MQSNKQKNSSTGIPTPNALFISLEKNLLREKQGDAFKRHLRYSRHFNKLNVIVLSTKKDKFTKPLHFNNLHVYPTNSLSRWFFVWDAIRIALSLHQKNKFDFISSQDPFITAIAGICIKWMIRAPLNIQIHNDFASSYFKFESLQNFILSLVYPVTLRLADNIRAVSLLTSKLIPKRKDSFIVPIAVDVDFFKSDKRNKEVDIVSVARLAKQKNFPLLIQVISELKNDFPNINAVIAGEGREKNKLEALIRANNLNRNIKFVGARNRHQVKNLLQKGKIFVLPSNYEGWGLVTVEAAACGLPVIMSDTGGAREIIKNNKTGYIFPVNDKDKLKQLIQKLLNNNSLRDKMGENAKNWVTKQFSRHEMEIQWINSLISNNT